MKCLKPYHFFEFSMITVLLCLKGVGFHHAALHFTERRYVEQLFLNGDIFYLCTTSTLALGVNLPAHLVVIKGTESYRGGQDGYKEIEVGVLLQMIGRAGNIKPCPRPPPHPTRTPSNEAFFSLILGRPQFDTHGVAVILTSTDRVTRYKNLEQCPPVESSLHLVLAEKLNIEVAMGNVKNWNDASMWLTKTFLFVRFKQNPTAYQHSDEFKDLKDQTLEALLYKQVTRLMLAGVLFEDAKQNFQKSELGHIMFRQNMKLCTIDLFSEIKNESSMRDILNMISLSKELHTPVKRAEKRILNDLHKQCKFQITKSPKSKSLKLVQEVRKPFNYYISCYKDLTITAIDFRSLGSNVLSYFKPV